MTHKNITIKTNELANAKRTKKGGNCFLKRSKNENITIYDNDIEAIKTNTAIENASKSQVNDNLLFAKLLAYVVIDKFALWRYKSID
jgi:hypothetical protein